MLSRRKLEQNSSKRWRRHGYDLMVRPRLLQFDEARPFNSEELKRFLEQRIQPVVAPGEAHFKLGDVERRHQVFRAAVETHIQQEKLPLTLESVVEAVF